jgi:D-amino peptidase
MRWLIFLMCASSSLWAQKKAIFLVTDAEGVGGICRQEQTEPKDAELRQLLTGEINAAVEGFLAGGADEVLVWDGHDGSQTLSALTIHPKAKLVMGALGASMMMDRRFSAVAFVGQHSRANMRGGVMAHSYSSLGIQNMLLNGKPVGEIDVIAAMAGHFGTPVIMLSGDQAAANEIREIVPNVEVAVVKEGIGRYTCISLSAAAARDAVREAAHKSVGKDRDDQALYGEGTSNPAGGVHHAELTTARRGGEDRRGGIGRSHNPIQGARHSGGVAVVPVTVGPTRTREFCDG